MRRSIQIQAHDFRKIVIIVIYEMNNHRRFNIFIGMCMPKVLTTASLLHDNQLFDINHLRYIYIYIQLRDAINPVHNRVVT